MQNYVKAVAAELATINLDLAYIVLGTCAVSIAAVFLISGRLNPQDKVTLRSVIVGPIALMVVAATMIALAAMARLAN